MKKVNKIKTLRGYDFYEAEDDNGRPIFDIIRTGSIPSAGFYEKEYITKIKGFTLKDWKIKTQRLTKTFLKG